MQLYFKISTGQGPDPEPDKGGQLITYLPNPELWVRRINYINVTNAFQVITGKIRIAHCIR